MKAIDDFIKDANSILNTLDKDYEAMQSQKSNVRQDQVNKFNDLCENMSTVLRQYSETIQDFNSKIGKHYDSHGTEVTVYEYPDKCKILTMTPILYWTSTNKLTFYIILYIKHKNEIGIYNSEELIVSDTGVEQITSGFNGADTGFSETVSVFLNHCPTYDQLDTAFQTALTNYIKYCVTFIQKRNENLADKIKSITE